MGRTYTISCKLEIEFNLENIKQILERGKKLGFSYHHHIYGETNIDSPSLSLEKAIESIEKNVIEYNSYIILIQYKDTYFELSFANESSLSFMVHLFSVSWVRKYQKNEDAKIDFHRYIILITQLIHEYQILDLHAHYGRVV